MTNQRYRPVLLATLALAGVWLLAWGGFRIAGSFRMTAEKFSAFANGLDLDKLNAEKRARALRDLADKLNHLDAEERRRIRMSHTQDRLFNQMNDEEKGYFIEATMPTGFKQMIASFEQLPPDKRKRAIEGSVKRLKAQRESDASPGDGTATNRPPPLNEELQKKIITLGLKTFYSESSAQTKAEVAPFLEELQRTMESGRLFH
jgi:hypothetical protein